MLLRALIAFLLMPGIVAFVVPLLLRSSEPAAPFSFAGLAALGPGLVVLGWCVRDFYVLGRGTLAPWDPPRRLVVRGLYRFSRNPMYVGVLLVVAGWAIGFRSLVIGGYAAVLALLFHLRVVLGEEPWLARTHGAAWTAYAAAVPRWLGRASAPPEDVGGPSPGGTA